MSLNLQNYCQLILAVLCDSVVDIYPIPTRQNFGPDQIESIYSRQIKCNKNDNFFL